MITDDPLWYKDAIIYELHVKAFFDSNDDGIGDFRGLNEKLDYLQALGVTCIWLLPFYPSPQRDDGYDIADYRSVHPGYGTMRDFRDFVREAHRRNIHVLTELVINHTSDQHPWFQRARAAPPGSRYRDWYVWSDTDTAYKDTRIIFTDTELSNWTWDPLAKSYYWHRFFSHQPDLNFANPQVVRSVIDVMRYWLDIGVDGLRLDAIPYLCEREGTNNENLPETHAVLKELRAALDARHKNRMFLAEANQWPEDVQSYFGDGDECHMAYHFPLMPRMYMAIAQEDRHPITDILRQTPDIPANCQWAIFLRNHDELTLEMVTDSERDYLWKTYAADARARINIGIRRRLAPLMENDRRKIELMNSLLMSLPGTPTIYYGDELGMGDNFYLGDRNGVRTPMQWTPDRNGGFSRGDPATLYLPPLMDPVYGYQSINVEAQLRSPSSLLNWMRRLIAVRQGHKVFGRGTLTFLYPDNRRILAFLRQHEDETVLCVANLSRSAQAFSLDLSQFIGRIPIELMGRNPFPIIRDGAYQLSLQGYSFYWFMLQDAQAQVDMQGAAPVTPDLLPEFATLVVDDGWNEIIHGRAGTILLQHALPKQLMIQKWFPSEDMEVKSTSLATYTTIPARERSFLFSIFTAHFGGAQKPCDYFMPLGIAWKELRLLPPVMQAHAIAKTRRGPREGTLYDAIADDDFIAAIVSRMDRAQSLSFDANALVFTPTRAMTAIPEPISVRRMSAEQQTSSSVFINDHSVLKFYRVAARGIEPEIEIGRYLTDVAGFANAPALLASVELKKGAGQPTAIAALHAFVRNQGDAWTVTLNYLNRFLDESVLLSPEQLAELIPAQVHAAYLDQVAQLGLRTAELHRAFCPDRTSAAFQPEPAGTADIAAWRKRARGQARDALAALRRAHRQLSPSLRTLAARIFDQRAHILDGIDGSLPSTVKMMKIRIHGNFHLRHVLLVKNDFYITGLTGDPRRAPGERRQKDNALRDVAGILRAFDAAGWTALQQMTAATPERLADMERLVLGWSEEVSSRFLNSYFATMAGCAAMPRDDAAARSMLRLFMLEDVFYEIRHTLANHPAGLAIPLRAAAHMLLEGQN